MVIIRLQDGNGLFRTSNRFKAYEASVPSRLDYRVEPFEFDARIRCGELPVDALAGRITLLLPSLYLVP